MTYHKPYSPWRSSVLVLLNLFVCLSLVYIATMMDLDVLARVVAAVFALGWSLLVRAYLILTRSLVEARRLLKGQQIKAALMLRRHPRTLTGPGGALVLSDSGAALSEGMLFGPRQIRELTHDEVRLGGPVGRLEWEVLLEGGPEPDESFVGGPLRQIYLASDLLHDRPLEGGGSGKGAPQV